MTNDYTAATDLDYADKLWKSADTLRGPSVLDLLWSAAGVIAALQSKRDQPRPEDDQVPQERETAETDPILSPSAAAGSARARMRTHS